MSVPRSSDGAIIPIHYCPPGDCEEHTKKEIGNSFHFEHARCAMCSKSIRLKGHIHSKVTRGYWDFYNRRREVDTEGVTDNWWGFCALPCLMAHLADVARFRAEHP